MNPNRTFRRLPVLLLAFAFALLAVLPARAQFFGEYRSIQLVKPTLIIGAASSLVSNAPVDLRGYEGIATVTIFSGTNAAGGTCTLTLQTSTDKTNWTSLSNYALYSAANVIYTNTYYGTNDLTATNTFFLPGTITKPPAATAGWATPYLSPALFTNSGTINVATNGIQVIAYNVQDAPRYLQALWTTGGTTTNIFVGAVVNARKQQFP